MQKAELQKSGLQAVAQLAGVSLATASRALQRPELVAEPTRQRVRAAATQLDYRPNVMARSLRTRGTRTLGLIVTDILNPFHALLAKGAQDAADRAGYTLLMFNTDEEPLKERRALDTLRGHLPQGLILVPTPGTRENIGVVGDLPVIELDRRSGRPGTPSVMVDNVAGAREAVEHLIGLGHRRIGMVVGQRDISTAQERHQGYCLALEAADIPYDEALVRPGNHREADGRRAAHELLGLSPRPTALFVGNNEMTVGAVLAARELGLQLPAGLSIVGFDDSRWAQTMDPPITVVAQPGYDLGRLACEHLLALLERGTPPPTLRLPTELVPRQSTSPPGRPGVRIPSESASLSRRSTP